MQKVKMIPGELFTRAIAGMGWRARKIRSRARTFVLSLCQSYLQRCGYGVYRTSSLDVAAASNVKESQYYTQWCAPCPLFTPWVGHPDFQALYEGVAPHTIVSVERCYTLVSLAHYAKYLRGDFAECGVYKGGTALLLCRVLKNTGKILRLFDSFEGLPSPNRERDNTYTEGTFAINSVESVYRLLGDWQNMIEFRQGWIPDTFIGIEDHRYSFAHIDVDLYQSTLDCCEYFYPRLVPGGVLLFDDYGFPAARGEKDAVDEFFADKPESPITLLSGQAILLKVPPNKNHP
jgi:O-methyltransferase